MPTNKRAAKPDPARYLDMTALPVRGDPALFMAEFLEHVAPNRPTAQENARFLRWLSRNMAAKRQLETNDPVLLFALGSAICDGAARRRIIRYLEAVDQIVEAAGQRQDPGT